MNGNESPFELPDEVERCLATLSKMYEKRGDTKLEKIIVNAKPLVQEMTTTGSWNDGSAGHTLHLIVPASIFPSSVEEKTKSEISILNDINKIHHVQNEYIESVRLQMDTQTAVDWRQQSGLQIADKRVIAVSTTDRIWGRAGYFRVFLSHKSEVKEETAKLKEKLKIYGITCFVAHTDIEPTKEWQTEIENALHSMDALIALLTDDFHNSDWTDQEVGFAFGRSVPIIPVKLGRDPYGFMGKFQALPATWDTAAKEIVKVLLKQEGMVNAYIKAVNDCASFEGGNALSELLPLIETMSGKQIADLISAYSENGNVRGSFGFNGMSSYRYGNGLIPHLNRWTGKKYGFSHDGKIEIKQ